MIAPQRLPSALLLVLLFTCVPGCDDTTPTAPSAPMSVLVTIVPGTSLLRVGERVTLSTFIARSDGTGGTQAASWSSDRPAVAAVDADGTVQGLAPGTATLTAIATGSPATRTVRVVPDVEGRWPGTYRVLVCDGSADACALSLYNASPGNDGQRLTLGQLDDEVRGELRIGSTSIAVEGSIRETGELELSGAYEWIDTDGQFVRRTRLLQWRTRVAEDGRTMSGGFRLIEEVRGRTPVTIDAELVTSTRAP